MAEVLSQSEIDALLSAVSSGSVDTNEPQAKAGKSGADWISYDLTSQEKVVRGRLAGLQGIHERFARHLRITLSNTLKKSVTVNLTGIEFVKFGDYLTNILLPTSMNILSMPQLKGSQLFVISSKLAYAFVDAYYGGNERPFSKIGGREEFTNVENNMIRKISQMVVNDLTDAWKLNYPLELEYLRTEANPHFVGVIHTSELVAVVSFEVEFENLSGPFVLILQLRAFDPIQQSLSVNVAGEMSDDVNAWRDHWLAELAITELVVKVDLGESERSLREVQELKVGSTIVLSQDHAAALTILIQDVPKLKGLMGTYRGNRAVRLMEDLKPIERGK